MAVQQSQLSLGILVAIRSSKLLLLTLKPVNSAFRALLDGLHLVETNRLGLRGDYLRTIAQYHDQLCDAFKLNTADGDATCSKGAISASRPWNIPGYKA